MSNLTVFPNGIQTGDLQVDGTVTLAEALQARRAVQALTATGAITIDNGVVTLSHATVVIAATLDAPTAGDELFIINTSASGTAAHTVTLPEGVTWNGTHRVATLNAPNEGLHVVAVSATRFYIVQNNGSVAFS